MNYKIILKFLGILIIIIGICMVSALLWSLYYKTPDAGSLLKSITICLISGGLLYTINFNARPKAFRREAFMIVGLGWFVASLFGCLPFIFSGTLPNFFDAFFETVSGFSTTGASVMSGAAIESAGKGILFWRSCTHWLGGMGIIVLFVAIFPFLGIAGRHLIKYETPGPIKSGFEAKTVDTARILWYIYLGLSFIEMIFLLFAGMNLYEAMCHTFGTMATGGFSVLGDSIGGYHSRSIDLIITVFMIAAGINFAHYYKIITGNWISVLNDTELRVYLSVFLLSTLIISALLVFKNYYSTILSALRYSAFQVAAVITTTGYGTANFDIWPSFCKILFVMLMFCGGCAGSTGGGMKVIRIIILIKYAGIQLFKMIHPQAAVTLKIDKQPFPKPVVRQVLGFFVIAIGLFLTGSLLVSLYDFDIVTSTTSVAATLWNIGPGLAKVGSIENYGFFPDSIKFLFSILMVVGRLELFTILVFFVPAFWK